MEKNTILAIVVAFVVWFLWDSFLEKKYPGYKERYGSEKTEHLAKKDGTKQPSSLSQGSATASGNLSTPGQPAEIQPRLDPQIGGTRVKLLAMEDLILHTANLEVRFSQTEGTIDTIILKKFFESKKETFLGAVKGFFGGKKDKERTPPVKLESRSAGRFHSYYFQLLKQLPYGTLYEVINKTDRSIKFRGLVEDYTIEKEFTFVNPYQFTLRISVTNGSSAPFSTRAKLILFDSLKEEEAAGGFLQAGMATGKSAVLNTIGSQERAYFKDFDPESIKETLWTQTGLQVNWLGVDSQYFLKALLPKTKKQNADIEKIDDNQIKVGVIEAIDQLLPGKQSTFDYQLYFGPKDIDILEKMNQKVEEAIDFGWLAVIAVPILKLLKWIYSIIGNYGIAIILLTTLIKIGLLPLTWKSSISMKKMQKFQPELKKLQDKYKDDRQRLSQETMSFMKQNKMNPLGGCLPLLPQLPIFFALYRVLYNSIELRQAPFLGWISDLASKDPLFVLPLLTGVFMFLQQKIMPTAQTDPNQKTMFLVMNVMFTFMMLYLPSGAVLYILTNMILSIIQQVAINKYAKVS